MVLLRKCIRGKTLNYIQSETVLENSMVQTLLDLGYEKISISDDDALLANFKNQISLHNPHKHLNNTPMTDSEFERLTISLGDEFFCIFKFHF